MVHGCHYGSNYYVGNNRVKGWTHDPKGSGEFDGRELRNKVQHEDPLGFTSVISTGIWYTVFKNFLERVLRTYVHTQLTPSRLV